MRHFTSSGISCLSLSSLKDKNVIQEASETIRSDWKRVTREVNILHVGNLAETVTEGVLTKVFGRFGPLKQVKLMLPRNEVEMLRGKLSAFV
jgi:hypothetical protein